MVIADLSSKQVDNTSEHMARTDLGNNVMQVSHTKGTDRWLVVKKKLDASEVKALTMIRKDNVVLLHG